MQMFAYFLKNSTFAAQSRRQNSILQTYWIIAFAIYSLTYLETWEISICIAQVQWMSTLSSLICKYTLVCIVSNKGRMPTHRRGRFVVWRYGFSQDLKVWTRNRSCLFLCAKLPNTARKPCQNTRANGTQPQKNQQEPTRTNAFLAHPTKKHYLCKAKKSEKTQ